MNYSEKMVLISQILLRDKEGAIWVDKASNKVKIIDVENPVIFVISKVSLFLSATN